jgi:NAD dependent epimerase/dehydratase family enzyme
VLWALDGDDRTGVYNATAPNPVTNAELSKALGRTLGRPAVMPVPKIAMKARFGSELGEVITGGQRAVPRRALDGGFEFAEPEIEPALRNLLRR